MHIQNNTSRTPYVAMVKAKSIDKSYWWHEFCFKLRLYVYMYVCYGIMIMVFSNNIIVYIQFFIPGNTSLSSILTSLRSFPSLLIFHGYLQLSPSHTMELCCVVGALLAFLMMIFRAMRCSLMFAVLWFLYLSVYKVGWIVERRISCFKNLVSTFLIN